MAVSLQYCKTPEKTPVTTIPAEDMVSYETAIKPFMVRSCRPCHKTFDTYDATKDHVKEIIRRVQLPVDDAGYMPHNSKTEALTVAEIGLLKKWMTQGMGH